jgi:hypothetical protein
MAAVLACGPGAVLSHGSAAQLWSIRGAFGPPEVTRRSGGSPRAKIKLHQTRLLEDSEQTVEAGIPVTTIERTLLDLASRLGVRQLEHALVAADRTRRLSWSELERLCKRTPLRPGAGRLRRVARRIDPRAAEARSPSEVDFLALCREAHLPLPQVNVLAEGFLVDFLWPAQRVVVEADSYGYHADPPAFERDHRRTVVLTAAGYAVHGATYWMLSREPEVLLSVVRDSLERSSLVASSP